MSLKSEAEKDIGNDIVEDFANGLLAGIGNAMLASSLTQARFREQQEQNVTMTSKNKAALTDVSNLSYIRHITEML